MWVKFCDGRSPRTYPYVSEISSDIGAIRFVTRHPTTTRFINASITGQQSRSLTWIYEVKIESYFCEYVDKFLSS